MWEEPGTDIIDEEGHENWDKTLDTNNEVSLQFANDDKKQAVADILSKIVCEGNGKQDIFLQ